METNGSNRKTIVLVSQIGKYARLDSAVMESWQIEYMKGGYATKGESNKGRFLSWCKNDEWWVVNFPNESAIGSYHTHWAGFAADLFEWNVIQCMNVSKNGFLPWMLKFAMPQIGFYDSNWRDGASNDDSEAST